MSEQFQVPSQVDEAAELAEQLFAKMYPQTEEEEVEEESEIQASDEDDEDASDEDDTEEDEDDEPEIDPKELKKWRDRYLTLKGKYDAEVPRLASQVKELMEKVSTPATKTEEPVEEDDIETFESVYGEDFVNNLRRVIDAEVQSKLSQVTQKVDTVEDIQRQAATDSFMSYLDEKADGWRDLWEGKDKGFQKFLQQTDPMGLNTYETYLNQFNDNWDADGMSKIFNIYLESKKTKPDTSKEKDAMIAPSRNKTAQPTTDSGKQIWTAESIKQFEVDDRRGKYTDAESQALWADLLAAPSEGRIR